MTIFDALRQDHETQRSLLRDLTDTTGDSAARQDLFSRAKKALQDHAAAEERCFYAPLMEHDLTQEKARHSIAEHQEIDELIGKLDRTKFSSPAWLDAARELHHLVTHHLDEEEHEVFQQAGRVLTETQKQDLGTDYRREMDAGG